tara:strand:- start:791 stop:1726 length:936 start_codon:yes stop_codon:yes gene_type:complete
LTQFSIIIPVYKSGEWLESLVERIINVMKSINIENSFELILVNDASPDDITWEKILFLTEKYTWIKGIDLFFNLGQFKATLCGISHSKGEYIITMDDDYQQLPEEIPKLINAILSSKKIDCVFGDYEAVQPSKFRKFGTKLKSPIFNIFYKKDKNIKTSSFRILKKELANTLLNYKIAHPQPSPLITKITDNIINIKVKHNPRIKYKSNYSILNLIREIFYSLINASILPLRLISFLGILFSTCAFIVGIYTFLNWFQGGIKVEGFTTIVITITFFSGLILFSIGILSEYIGRIIREVSGFKNFPIRKKTF